MCTPPCVFPGRLCPAKIPTGGKSALPTQQLALERGGLKRLKISWKGMWKEFRVSVDGAEVGSVKDKQELQAGREFELPDGSRLNVQLTKVLELRHDGKPVPGSALDPVQRLKVSWFLLFFIGGGTLLLGLVAAALPSSEFSEAVYSVPNILIGIVSLTLGVLVRRRSRAALTAAVVLIGGTLAWRVIVSLDALSKGAVPMGLGGIVVGIMFLIAICRGFSALTDLESEEPPKAP